MLKRYVLTLFTILLILLSGCTNKEQVRNEEGFLLLNNNDYDTAHLDLDVDLNFKEVGKEPQFELGPLQININFIELRENPFDELATEQRGMEVSEAVSLDITLVATDENINLEDMDMFDKVTWDNADKVIFGNNNFKVETSTGEFFDGPEEIVTPKQISMDNFIYLNDRAEQRVVLWYPLIEDSLKEVDWVNFYILSPKDTETNEPLSNDLKIRVNVN